METLNDVMILVCCGAAGWAIAAKARRAYAAFLRRRHRRLYGLPVDWRMMPGDLAFGNTGIYEYERRREIIGVAAFPVADFLDAFDAWDMTGEGSGHVDGALDSPAGRLIRARDVVANLLRDLGHVSEWTRRNGHEP